MKDAVAVSYFVKAYRDELIKRVVNYPLESGESVLCNLRDEVRDVLSKVGFLPVSESVLEDIVYVTWIGRLLSQRLERVFRLIGHGSFESWAMTNSSNWNFDSMWAVVQEISFVAKLVPVYFEDFADSIRSFAVGCIEWEMS